VIARSQLRNPQKHYRGRNSNNQESFANHPTVFAVSDLSTANNLERFSQPASQPAGRSSSADGVERMSFIFKTVGGLFARQPTLSNAATGFACFGIGEMAAQKTENRPADLRRAAQIGALGCIMNGVVMMRWFAYLDAVFGTSMTSPRTLICKTVADQIVYAPFGITTFFAYSCMLDQVSTSPTRDTKMVSSAPIVGGQSPSFVTRWSAEFSHLMDSSFMKTFTLDCCVWPMVNMIQFRFVPLNFRPAVNGIVATAWQSFVSHESHSESPSSPPVGL
jgi:protein Mpv17